MKRNTPLDYAEFLLTHSRTRCELQICANGVKEKLASGYLKPFIAHLRAAEEQVAKGNQVVRLEHPSNFLKKNKVTWFTKGTLERFVRFVSTPEVLERVKNIDDELSQLEHVRIALSRTSSQSDTLLHTKATEKSGVYQRKGSVSMKDKRLSVGALDTGADASKIELLRAMDVRLIALKQEQSEAFSRAIAAGFDNSNMADLLDFSEHFGAVRLREACVQYVDLFRKRSISQEVSKSMESPSVDAASSDSDMSLESCMDFEPIVETEQQFGLHAKAEWSKVSKSNFSDNAGELKLDVNDERENLENIQSSRIRSRWGPPERIQMSRLDPEAQDGSTFRKNGEAKHHLGNYSHQEDIRQSTGGLAAFESSGEFQTRLQPIQAASVSRFGGSRLHGSEQGGDDIKGGVFFSRLRKMAQQVEARRSTEDLGVQFTSVECSTDLSGCQLNGQNCSIAVNDSMNTSSSSPSPLLLVSDGLASQPQNLQGDQFSSNPWPRSISSTFEETRKIHSGSPNSLIDPVVDFVTAKDGDKDRKDNFEKLGSSTSETDKAKGKQEEPVSTSARRLSVQAAISLFESKKATMGDPPIKKLGRQDSEKALVRVGSSSTDKSVLHRWGGVGSDGTDTKQVTVSESDEKGQEKDEPAEKAVQQAVTSVEDSKRMNELFQSAITHASQSVLKSSTLAMQSATVPVDASCLENMTPVQKNSIVSVSANAHEVLEKQSKQEADTNFTRNISSSLRTSVNFPSKPGPDASKFDEVTMKRGIVVSGPESNDTRRAPLPKESVGVQVDARVQMKQNLSEQKSEGLPGTMCRTEITSKRQSNSMEYHFGSQFVEEPKVGSLKQKTNKSRPSESKLPPKAINKPDEEPFSILHETPVDLYMQALVMMIDNNQQRSLNLGDETASKEQRGRLYEQYRQLRNARRKGENPAKREEREAKLKSMQEILERRKAEMEAGVCSRKKNSRLIKENDGLGRWVQESGPLMLVQDEKEMGEDEVDKVVLDFSDAPIMPNIEVKAVKKVAPYLQKSAVTSRSMATSRRILKNQTTVGLSVNNIGSLEASSHNGYEDSAVYANLAVDSRKNASKLSSVCTEALVKTHEESTQVESDAAPALLEVLSKTVIVDFTCQPSDTRQGQALVCGEAQLKFHTGHVVTFPHEKSLFAVAENVEHQHHEYFTSSGIDVSKQNGYDYQHSGSWEGLSCPCMDDPADMVFIGREGAVSFDTKDPIDYSKLNHVKKHSFMLHPEESRSNANEIHSETNSMNNPVYKDKDEENSLKLPPRFSGHEESHACPLDGVSQNDPNLLSVLLQERTSSTYSVAATSPISSLKENDRILRGTDSPRHSVSRYSPSSSPVSWISLKTKHLSEHERLPSMPQTTKEPARGFKRLLRFGRKSRNTDSMLPDGISASTPSEAEDETEEGKEPMRQPSSSELFQRDKTQEKMLQSSNDKHNYGLHERGESYSLQTSIPSPPSNFKALDDRFSGSNPLKASRSFFSLSSFRSKGGEGKLR